MCRNGALSELCDFLDFGRCVEFILKLKDGSKQDLREYQILSLVHPPSVVLQQDRHSHTISDCSYFGINDITAKLAPQTSMQFDWALH